MISVAHQLIGSPSEPMLLATDCLLDSKTGIVNSSQGVLGWSVSRPQQAALPNFRKRLVDAGSIRGTAYLAFNDQFRNAYHILLEWGRALCVYRDLQFAQQGIRIILPESHRRERYLSLIVKRLGLERLVHWVDDVSGASQIHIDALIVPRSLCSNWIPRDLGASAASWYRKLALEAMASTPSPSDGDWIYVSRRDSSFRVIENEEDLESALESIGFSVVLLSSLSVSEVISAFASASIVVGPHGAGLSNLVFRVGERRVLELMPDTYRNECFVPISRHYGDHHAISYMKEVASSDSQRMRRFQVHVPSMVEQALSMVGAQSADNGH